MDLNTSRPALLDRKKFDLQLSGSQVAEDRLAAILGGAKCERIELKTETYQWEQTGNICIEFRWNGKPSGIAATTADFWVHELCRDGQPLVYLWFPIKRLRSICRKAYLAGQWRENAGDGGRSSVILLPLKDILR